MRIKNKINLLLDDIKDQLGFPPPTDIKSGEEDRWVRGILPAFSSLPEVGLFSLIVEQQEGEKLLLQVERGAWKGGGVFQ